MGTLVETVEQEVCVEYQDTKFQVFLLGLMTKVFMFILDATVLYCMKSG